MFEPQMDSGFEYLLEDGNAVIVGYRGSGGQVTVPDRLGGRPVTAIQDNAFLKWPETPGDDVTGLILPDTLTRLAEDALAECHMLQWVRLPASVRFTGNPFCGTGIQRLELAPGASDYRLADGVLYSADGERLICYPPDRPGEAFEVPRGVTVIGRNAFRGSRRLTAVTLSDTVTAIEPCAFSGCKALAQVALSESVSEIDANPFADSPALTHVRVSPRNPHFRDADGVLYSLDGITLICYPGGRTDERFTVPNGVTRIGERSFAGHRHIREVALGRDVKVIGPSAFANAPVKKVTLPRGMSGIEGRAFFWCRSLAEISLPDTVTALGDEAFESCRALKRIRISRGLRRLRLSAFRGCDSLKSLVVPEGVETLVIDDSTVFPGRDRRRVFVPLSVNRVINHGARYGDGYVFYAPRSRRRLWSRLRFCLDDAELRPVDAAWRVNRQARNPVPDFIAGIRRYLRLCMYDLLMWDDRMKVVFIDKKPERHYSDKGPWLCRRYTILNL